MDDLLTQLSIITPAFVAGVLVLGSHVPLGREVLRRGIIFLDIAVAQIAAFGIMLTAFLHLEGHPWLIQLVAIGSALFGAWLLHLCERRWPQFQEAIIGTAFVLAASGSILLMTGNPHSAEHLKDILSGQILWVSQDQLLILGVFSLGVALLWWRLSATAKQRWFYPLFAVAITASVQVVGIYLVFSSLIIPALAVVHQTQRPVVKAWFIGVLGYLLGLLFSTVFDLPSGPLIVWLLVTSSVSYALLRRIKQRKIITTLSAPVD